MTDLREEVRRLLLEERLSSKEVGRRLGLSPSQVMAIKAGKLETLPVPSAPDSPLAQELHSCVEPRSGSSTPSAGGPGDSRAERVGEAEQIQNLRRRVRAALLERIEKLPPQVLVRLWQLVEDPRLLEGSTAEGEDPFELSEEVREKIFELLDSA